MNKRELREYFRERNANYVLACLFLCSISFSSIIHNWWLVMLSSYVYLVCFIYVFFKMKVGR